MSIEDLKLKMVPVLHKHHIKRAGIFGSVANGNSTLNSDIDVLVELGDGIGLLEFVGIKLELEGVLRRNVDLVEYKAIKPMLRNRILNEEVRIYEA